MRVGDSMGISIAWSIFAPILIILGICVISGLSIMFFIKCNTEEKVISLPEEIQIAQEGDTLFVYKVSNDTIYVGFKK